MTVAVSTASPRKITSVEELYHFYGNLDGDIREHLPDLKMAASKCRHVTEFGTRAGVSTAAFLAGQPDKLVAYDVNRHASIDEMQKLRGKTDFQFVQADVLQVNIEPTDLLFIDTWHVYEQLRAELAKHAPKVRKFIVLHDTTTFGEKGESPGHRGLWPAIEEFLLRSTFKLKNRLHNCNGLTVLERIAPESQASTAHEPIPARVYLSFPFYQQFYGQGVDAWDNAVDPHGEDCCVKAFNGGAFHARNFNQLWCGALNSRATAQWTHFAMIHHDVRPEGYWLSRMLQEMRQHKADLLHVVLPIKTDHGLTSTAVRDRKTGVVRRLTMREIMALDNDTFDAASAGFPECDLLASTGLWICDFTQPWVEKVWFEVRDRIVFDPDDGLFKTETSSEDWAFSMALHKLGVRIMGTRTVPCGHWGPQEFRNDAAWGAWETDRGKVDQPFTDCSDWGSPG